MTDTVIFLNACFTYMSLPEVGNFLLARLLRRKGNTPSGWRFARWHILYTNLYTMITTAKNLVLAKA
ncbi:hypothetical protein [Scytonema sp. HK-05]|uniref:hypothetical protein n=1 Tax=Scytonema sp. HK-05 TaxID=1137095 RepID=UPI001161158F|nr:hypothetical protein [Scytonema sp. HK-05]